MAIRSTNKQKMKPKDNPNNDGIQSKPQTQTEKNSKINNERHDHYPTQKKPQKSRK